MSMNLLPSQEIQVVVAKVLMLSLVVRSNVITLGGFLCNRFWMKIKCSQNCVQRPPADPKIVVVVQR